MKTDQVVICGDFTFSLYGDRHRGYHLEVWDHSENESQRLDIPLNALAGALPELGMRIEPTSRPEIEPFPVTYPPEGKNRPKPA